MGLDEKRSKHRMVLLNLAELPLSHQRRRNQVIFEYLAGEGSLFTDGVYINPSRVFRGVPPVAALRDFVRPIIRTLDDAIAKANPTFVLPFSLRAPVARLQTALFVARLRSHLAGRPYCLWVNTPEYHPFLIAQQLRQQAITTVVDLSDDFTAFFNRDQLALESRLRHLVANADALIAVNQHVAQKFPHKRCLVFPNATNFEALQRHNPAYALGDVLPRAGNSKVVGFIGGLHRGRVDEPLLLNLISTLPDVLFLFVGYSNDPSLLARLSARSNVRVFSAVPYDELAFVIRAFDVAIVPHLDNEFTRGSDLLKVRDYLACGVPVVSTRSSGVERYGSAVYVTNGPDDFVGTVARLLSGAITHDPQPGLNIARAESWSNTLPQLLEWLRPVLGPLSVERVGSVS